MAGRGGASAAAPLLEKTAAAAESGGGCCYVDGCPGCAVDRHKAANPGIPYGNFIYVWIVTLCTGNSGAMASLLFPSAPYVPLTRAMPMPMPMPCVGAPSPSPASVLLLPGGRRLQSKAARPLARTVASVVRAASCMLWPVGLWSVRFRAASPPPALLLLIPDPLVPGGVRNVRDTARPNQTGPGGICASSPPTPTCTSVSA